MRADEGLVCRIVKAFVAHNRVQPEDLGGLILDVHLAIVGLREAGLHIACPSVALPSDAWAAELPARSERTLPRIRRSLPATDPFSPAGTKPTPEEIRRSITETHLFSFEDGKPYAMLKRHLTARGLTPDEYRKKWGLPLNYPMVAGHYTIKRSELAQRTGLGRNKSGPARPEGSKPTLVEIRRSISDARLVSFEDGKSYVLLKTHLTLRGMTPDEYREKWGLPPDYPMVAPNYAHKRAALARGMSLGRNRTRAAPPVLPPGVASARP